MTEPAREAEFAAILGETLLFGDLLPAELLEVTATGRERLFPAGSVLAEAGSEATSIYCVIDGLLTAGLPINQRPRLVIGQTELVGAAALVFPHRYLVTAIAASDVRVLQIKAATLLARAEADEGFGYRLMRGMARDAVHRLGEIFSDAAGHPMASYVEN